MDGSIAVDHRYGLSNDNPGVSIWIMDMGTTMQMDMGMGMDHGYLRGHANGPAWVSLVLPTQLWPMKLWSMMRMLECGCVYQHGVQMWV